MIIYLEGVHGSGKTEVMGYISKNYDNILKEKYEKINYISEAKPPKDITYGGSFLGELWFLNHYVNINERLLNSRENEIFLVDRHPLNILLYGKVFVEKFKRGKKGFNEEKYSLLRGFYNKLLNKIAGGKIIFLYADYENLKGRIIKRKRETKKEWNEDDWEYLHLIKEEYDIWYELNKENVIKINTSNLSLKQVAEKIISIVKT